MTRRGELRLVQLVVVTLVLEQLTMASLLDDVAVFHDEDEVSVPDSGEAMGDDEASTLLAQVCHRLLSIVAKVISDKVMSQVELVTGNLSIVSLVSTEAVRELGLQVGSIAVAKVKATNVSLQLPVTR